MKLILLGAPGAGKGTQAEIISKKLNIPTISTGNILRAAVKNGTPVGLKAKEYMDAGKLVPDEVIIGVITERLQEADCKDGYILDGVPRTIAQAEALEAAGIHFDHVVSLEVSDEEVEQRMTGRRTCLACGATYHIVANPPKRPSRIVWLPTMLRPNLSRASMKLGASCPAWRTRAASTRPTQLSWRF